MLVYLPTYDIIVEIHDMVLQVSGGKKGVHVPNDIHRAVERPKTYTAYVADYDIDTVCAVLIDSIARYHGFRDGNKRTALMTAMLTYRMNEIHFKATVRMNNDFDTLVMWVVTDKPEIPEIEHRLKGLRGKYGVEVKQGLKSMITSFVRMRIKKLKS